MRNCKCRISYTSLLPGFGSGVQPQGAQISFTEGRSKGSAEPVSTSVRVKTTMVDQLQQQQTERCGDVSSGSGGHRERHVFNIVFKSKLIRYR